MKGAKDRYGARISNATGSVLTMPTQNGLAGPGDYSIWHVGKPHDVQALHQRTKGMRFPLPYSRLRRPTNGSNGPGSFGTLRHAFRGNRAPSVGHDGSAYG